MELILQFSQFYSVSPTFLVTGQEHFTSGMTVSLAEIDLVKKYRALSERGKEAVDLILDQPEASVVFVLGKKDANPSHK